MKDKIKIIMSERDINNKLLCFKLDISVVFLFLLEVYFELMSSVC